MPQKKVYISGKISGIENEAPKLFAIAEEQLKSQGFEVINPLTINHDHNKSWQEYMKADIKALCDCDTIFMLKNWRDSQGARIELALASWLGIHVIHQN